VKIFVLVIIAAVLMTLPFLLSKTNKAARSARAIVKAVEQAEAPMLQPGGIPEIERFKAELESINTTNAPPALREALRNYIQAVDDSLQVRRNRGDTNASNNRVVEAKIEFRRAAERATSALLVP
jgi:hypothetical protein